jgi:hypothetical protein
VRDHRAEQLVEIERQGQVALRTEQRRRLPGAPADMTMIGMSAGA